MSLIQATRPSASDGLVAWIKDEEIRKFVMSLLKEKDKRIEEKNALLKRLIQAKDESLRDKDARVEMLQKQLLKTRGLLTCRGVLKYFAEAFLKPLVIGARKRMSTTQIYVFLCASFRRQDPPPRRTRHLD